MTKKDHEGWKVKSFLFAVVMWHFKRWFKMTHLKVTKQKRRNFIVFSIFTNMTNVVAMRDITAQLHKKNFKLKDNRKQFYLFKFSLSLNIFVFVFLRLLLFTIVSASHTTSHSTLQIHLQMLRRDKDWLSEKRRISSTSSSVRHSVFALNKRQQKWHESECRCSVL